MQPETKIAASDYPLVESTAQKFFVKSTQIIIAPILLTIRLLVVRNELYRDTAALNLKSNGSKATYILYSNHQSMLDPFIISASLPLRTIKQLLPFRFFVENSYFKGSLRAFLNVLGGFPAHYEANKPYGLDKARSLMASNQTVVIFPPGMRTRKHVAKSGVSILATEPNSFLIPAHIDWKSRWHCEVHIGAPIKGGVAHTPEQLMEHVYQLPELLK